MSKSEVTFRAETIQYSGAKELLQYFVKEIRFCDDLMLGQNGIMVEIILGRREK